MLKSIVTLENSGSSVYIPPWCGLTGGVKAPTDSKIIHMTDVTHVTYKIPSLYKTHFTMNTGGCWQRQKINGNKLNFSRVVALKL